ncbi:MAG: hypothetical protein ABJL99_18865 [Aliishimia sp.]
MNWGWTSRSAQGGVSVLAVVETSVASVGAIWIAMVFDTFVHVFMSAAIAPLLMLRSDESVASAAYSFGERLKGKFDQEFDWAIFSLFPGLIFHSFLTRIRYTLRYAHKGVPRLAQNYADALFRTDSAVAPELVPETVSVPDIVDNCTDFGRFNLETIVAAFILLVMFFGGVWLLGVLDPWIGQGGLKMVLAVPLTFCAGILAFSAGIMLVNMMAAFVLLFIAIWIRLSVKSTALIWLPLVYLASRAPKSFETAQLAIKEERASALAGIVRVGAWVSLAFFVWRALIFPSTYAWWVAQPWAESLLVFVMPLGTPAQDLHPWHLASGIGAVVTLASYYLIWERYGRDGVTARAVTGGAVLGYQGYYWARGVISVYSIMCGFYFAAIGAKFIALPGVSNCWFPWWC